jgi:hypothetical protein
MKDPYFFPFEKIKSSYLIPGEKYYIKLNDKMISDFLNKRRKLPVSHLEGIFVRLYNAVEGLTNIEYAVFKNVKILNKEYKPGSCSQMLVKYENGSLSSDDCNTYSDYNNRTINENREVYFSSNKWIFGQQVEKELLVKKVFTNVKPILNDDTVQIINEFRGTKREYGGKRNKKLKTKRNKLSKKNKIYKTRKTYKRY